MKKLKHYFLMKDQSADFKKWALFLGVLCSPMAAYASGYGDDGFVLVDMLHKLIDLITSKLGGAVFALAIAGIGYGWLGAGRIEKNKAIASIVGISLVFGASWMVQYFGFTV